MSYPELSGGAQYADINQQIKQSFGGAASTREKMISHFKEQAAETQAKTTPLPCTFKREYEIFQPNDSVLCVVFHSFLYWSGAAHGQHYDEALVFHLPSQRQLKAEDVFASREKALEALPALINMALAAQEMGNECNGIKEAKDLSPYLDNFAVRANSILFYFSDGIICPYSVGNPSVEISMEQLEEILR